MQRAVKTLKTSYYTYPLGTMQRDFHIIVYFLYMLKKKSYVTRTLLNITILYTRCCPARNTNLVYILLLLLLLLRTNEGDNNNKTK